MRSFPEEKLDAVQYSALIADLVSKTKQTLKHLYQQESDFVNLRMRTKFDVEIIVTNQIINRKGGRAKRYRRERIHPGNAAQVQVRR